MKLGNVSKAALVVALMMGQITPPSGNNDYYEDDTNFNTISSELHDGWGWGLNKAYASCDTYQGTDECRDIHPQHPLPVEPVEPDPYFDGGGSSSGGGGADPSGGGSSGGGSEPTEPAPEPTEPEPTEPAPEPTQTDWQTKYQECILEDISNKSDCYLIADGLYGTSLTLCTVFLVALPPVAGQIAAVACGTVASIAHTDQKGNCNEHSAEEQMFCQYLYPEP